MSNRHCPQCNCSIRTVKIGVTSARRQRYKCKTCGKTWTNKARKCRLEQRIWYDFTRNNMVVRVLADKYHKHPNKIREILNSHIPSALELSRLTPEEKAGIQVIVMDTTYFGRSHGVVVILDAHTGALLYFNEIFSTETNSAYLAGLETLLAAGIKPKACVIDGRIGLANILEDKGIFVQMCHFHMWQIVRRYITNTPVLEPNIELKNIIDSFLSKHTHVDRFLFAAQMNGWLARHKGWLDEKYKNEYGKYEFSHEETRRAYHAIKSHFPYLFTYEKHPELNIPKTSNIIEGKFGNVKDKLRLHHGYTNKLKIKILFSLLSGE